MLTDEQRAKFVRLTQRTVEAKLEYQRSGKTPPAGMKYARAVESLLVYNTKLQNQGISVPILEQVEVLREVASNVGLDYDSSDEFSGYRRGCQEALEHEAARTINAALN